jgi:purine-binding chemotaxis protein CheW
MIEQQVCTFFLNDIYFGIPVQHVQEVIRPHALTRVPLAPPDICGLMNLRGQIVTVIDLQRRLDMKPSERRQPVSTKVCVSPIHQPSEVEDQPTGFNTGFNIVVQTDREVVSFLVDDIGDIVDVTEAQFEPPPANLKGKMRQMLSGAYSLQNGFLLILDTERILAIKANS